MTTGIEVKTEFFPLAWILYFCTPVIEINGQKNSKSWGKHFFELLPGEYNVKVYFPYMGQKECGANQVKITLLEGQNRKISYNMPPWMFSKGTIKTD
jgi:hypothetical protein